MFLLALLKLLKIYKPDWSPGKGLVISSPENTLTIKIVFSLDLLKLFKIYKLDWSLGKRSVMFPPKKKINE